MSRLKQLFLDHVGQTIDTPLGIEVSSADGIYLYSPEGQQYIDLISGVTVSNVGHNNPSVVEAICNQARTYVHLMVYGEVIQAPQVEYAALLCSVLPEGLDRVYFVNSGSEAIEGALKLAKRFTRRTELISCSGAYHGSTHGALSVMGGEEYRNSFRPLLPDTRLIKFNSLDDLQHITERTAAVIVEPVQGEAGVISPIVGYLEALRNRCSEVGALLIFDEVQTGFGRVGDSFASNKFGVIPDILCMAKAMGGGLPLGGFAASDKIMSSLKTNPILGHITTFGGHPLSCAAGMAAFNYIIDNNLAAQANDKGEYLVKNIDLSGGLIKEVRAEGLLIAIEFGDIDISNKVSSVALHTEGLVSESFLFCPTAMRVAPPLTVTYSELDIICQKINRAVAAVTAQI